MKESIKKIIFRNKFKLTIFCTIIFIMSIIMLIVGLSSSFAAPLENDVRVKENSELIYYIDVLYDGKDGNAVSSSDNATAQVYSDYIYVEDELPEGLTFKGFVQTDDGTIGAVKRSDNTFCVGYVDGGVSGLKYDNNTRKVSFKVKNLQSGCKLTVGVITQTPILSNDVNRMDFYNTAYGREGSLFAKSNTVHVYIGRDDVKFFNVSYEYIGDVPEGVPDPPTIASYTPNSIVAVNQNITVSGYKFSGWSSDDVEVKNNVFFMPESDVVFRGEFTKVEEQKEQVSYTIEGDFPKGYLPPAEKEYSVGSDVKLDSLKAGDIINGYRFLGWNTTDVELSVVDDMSTIFTMPNHSVNFTGKFERISYNVSYQFQGSTIPPDANNLLPETEKYYPGDTVKVADSPQMDGYKFLGWYSSDSFVMPENDVVIYGEWSKEVGVFYPTVTQIIVDEKEFYSHNDVVQFQITVRNTADYFIKDVMLEELLEGCEFVSGSNYNILNEQYVRIPPISPNGEVVISAQYKVGSDKVKYVNNVVQITGAIADNGYLFDTTKNYKSEKEFIISNISLKIHKIDKNGELLSGAEFRLGYTREFSQSSLVSISESGSSEIIFKPLKPNSIYYLQETRAPTGYQLLSSSLKVNVDNNGDITIDGYEVSNEKDAAIVDIVNEEINILPNTGGIGIIPYVVLGLFLICVGSFCFIYFVRKRGDKSEQNYK